MPAAQLGRERDLAEGPAGGVQEPVDVVARRQSQQRGVVRAFVADVEERALQVASRGHAGRSAASAATAAHARRQRRDGRGDQRDHEARGAVGAGAASSAVRIASAPSSKARAAAAVAVDVDETGGEPRAVGIDRGDRRPDAHPPRPHARSRRSPSPRSTHSPKRTQPSSATAPPVTRRAEWMRVARSPHHATITSKPCSTNAARCSSVMPLVGDERVQQLRARPGWRTPCARSCWSRRRRRRGSPVAPSAS